MATAFMSNDPGSTDRLITIRIAEQFDPSINASIIREALKTAAANYAEKWLEENNDKIIERLNVDAIANMIMIEVAKQQTENIVGKAN